MLKNLIGDLDSQYFDWLSELVYANAADRNSYMRLLHRLHDTAYEWRIPMDCNRNADGVNLRYRFGDEKGIPDYIIANVLDGYPEASVLEVLVALALRMENDILHDDYYGDRTHRWFSIMVDNLGLAWADDDNFDEDEVDQIIDAFLRRGYDRFGHGCPFVVEHPETHMRNVELWYQMCWWVNEQERSGELD